MPSSGEESQQSTHPTPKTPLFLAVCIAGLAGFPTGDPWVFINHLP